MTRQTARCANCNRPFLREIDADWKRLCMDCWLATKARRGRGGGREERMSSSAPLFIDPQMVRRLIFLCHPDKHNGSAASYAATTFLLTLQRKETDV